MNLMMYYFQVFEKSFTSRCKNITIFGHVAEGIRALASWSCFYEQAKRAIEKGLFLQYWEQVLVYCYSNFMILITYTLSASSFFIFGKTGIGYWSQPIILWKFFCYHGYGSSSLSTPCSYITNNITLDRKTCQMQTSFIS